MRWAISATRMMMQGGIDWLSTVLIRLYLWPANPKFVSADLADYNTV